MARPEYHSLKDRVRLFKNTLSDPKDGVRDHAILRMLYGAPVRSVELCKFMGHDFVTDEGLVLGNPDCVVREAVAFNGKQRPMPLLDPILIEALQSWVDYRLAEGIGVTKRGFLDLHKPFFLKNTGEPFSVIETNSNGVKRQNSESINRVIRSRMKENKLTGSVDSALRTWTLDRHRECRDATAIWKLRGDADIESVKRIIRKYPVRLSALVEKVF